MISLLFQNPLLFIIAALGLVVAITIHECAHALAADTLGDPTPRLQGRVTLDPRTHLDPLGTVALLVTGFGWGKPVQFDPYNLREPLRDSALIAIAGPAANIVLALVLALLINSGVLPLLLLLAAQQILVVNVVLAVFNFIPVYPLDGSKILLALLPKETAIEYENFMHRYGLFVLIILLIPWGTTAPISQLIHPVINTIVNWLIRS